MYQEILFNLASPEIRLEMLEGREHMVVPAVAINEGVHNGSKGAILYLKNELARLYQVWDHKPTVVYHPMLNGQEVAAATPEVLNTQKVGIVLNTQNPNDDEAGKLKMETWLETERLRQVDDRVYNALKKGEKVEVSTGILVDIEWTAGVWNGEDYVGIARNIRPDHLAILPDEKGACSIAKGGGLLANAERVQNDMSHMEKHTAFSQAVQEKQTKPGYYWDGYVTDVFDGYGIYRHAGKYYQQNYTAKDGKVQLAGDPVEVTKEVNYRSITNNRLVGNAAGQHYTPEEYRLMTKVDKVTAVLAANSASMDETDREWLTALDEPKLDKMLKTANAAKAAPPVTAPAPTAVNNQAPPVLAPAPAPVNNGQMTDEEWLKRAPKRLQTIFNRAVERDTVERTELIERITNAAGNKFKKEYLETKDTEELEAIAALVPSADDNDGSSTLYNSGGRPMYTGSRFLGAAGTVSVRDDNTRVSNTLTADEFDNTGENIADFVPDTVNNQDADTDDDDDPAPKKKSKKNAKK